MQRLPPWLFKEETHAVTDGWLRAADTLTGTLAKGTIAVIGALDDAAVAQARLAGPGSLSLAVYGAKAARYDELHSWMTARADAMRWRPAHGRWVSREARRLNYPPGMPARVLDLFCGTGLTIDAIVKACDRSGVEVEVIGLDFTPAMLQQASNRSTEQGWTNVHLLRGDATNMRPHRSDDQYGGFNGVDTGKVDLVTAMCGMGALRDARPMWREILRVLKANGKARVSDMHCPRPDTPGHSLFTLRRPSHVLELVAWRHVIEINLGIWAWNDPTANHYLPLVTVWQDADGNWWGFEQESIEQFTEGWYGFPFMPYAHFVWKKVRLDQTGALLRKRICEALEIRAADTVSIQ